MIKQIYIENFQAWDQIHLDLHDSTVTVITGESEQGKSAIIRALNWLFHDEPSGDEFFRNKNKECKVWIKTKNNDTVERIKHTKKNINKYIINGQEFSALRNNTPQELQEVIKITKTNFQFQDDTHFLLSDSPSEVARKLNHVVGLNQIDPALKYVNKIVKQQSDKISDIQEDINNKNEQLEQFKQLNNIEKKFSKQQKLIKRRDKKTKQIKRLDELLNEIESYDIDYEQKLETLGQRLEVLKQKLAQIKKVKQNQNKLYEVITSLNESNSILIQKATIKQAESNLQKLSTLLTKISSTKEDSEKLSQIIKNLNKNSKNVNKIQRELDNSKKEFEELKNRLGFCPLCESILK